MRHIYRVEGIKIDLWPHRFKGIRGAYLNDSIGITVMVAKYLPPEPMIFTLAHELKHHLTDRPVASALCSSENEKDAIEIGAEVFAAELIYPEADFTATLTGMGIEPLRCTAEHLVRLKHDTETTLSYMALAKRAEFLNFAAPGSFAKVKWIKIAESLYGEPLYKRIQRNRRRWTTGRVTFPSRTTGS
jgi:hypothetical protein